MQALALALIYTTLVHGFSANFLLPTASSASKIVKATVSHAPEWIVLKSLILSLWCVALSSVSLVNFSLAFFTALLVVPPALFFRPTHSLVLNALQQFTLFALSPPVLLLLTCRLLETDPLQVFSHLLYGYQILSSWTFPIICFGYYPMSIAAMYMVNLPVE